MTLLNSVGVLQVVHAVSHFVGAAVAVRGDSVESCRRESELVLSQVWDRLTPGLSREPVWTLEQAGAFVRAAAEVVAEYLGRTPA